MAQKLSQDVIFYLRGDSVNDLAYNSTATITNGNPTINTTTPSLYFNGSNNYIKVAGLNFTNILSNDFTLEFEVNQSGITRQWATPLAIVRGSGGTTSERTLLSHWMTQDTLTFRDVGGEQSQFTKTGLTFDTWYHVAIVRSNGNISTYFDGSLLASRSASGLYTNPDSMYIGTMASADSNTYFNGYMKNILLTSGAKYTSNFTPTFDVYTTISITNVSVDENMLLTFNIEKNANENISKIEYYVNNTLISTQNSNFDNLSCNIPDDYTGIINVEIRVYFLNDKYISNFSSYNLTSLTKLELDSSLIDVNNKLIELKDFYYMMNDNIYNFLISNNIEVSEDEKKLRPLIEKMKNVGSLYADEIDTLNNTVNSLNSQITAKDNTINSLNSQITTKDNTINSLNSQITNLKSQLAKLCTFTVSSVSGASYGFTLSNGYFESTNKGVNSTYAICKVTITNPAGLNVYMDYINYAESNYDYGLVSKLNTTLSSSTSADSSSYTQLNCKGQSSSSVKTLNLGAVEGYIYVKFIKDSSTHSYNDSFKFTIRFE